MEKPLPRFTVPKLVKGVTRYYWNLPTYYRKQGCTLHDEHDTALGSDYERACARAAALNGLFDEWDGKRLGEPPVAPGAEIPGTVDWLVRIYWASTDRRERVSERSAPDLERTLRLLQDYVTKKGDRIGGRHIRSITPVSADKLYELIRDTPKRKGQTKRLRVAEKVVAAARHAWRVVHRLHPAYFDRDVPNPWIGVAMTRRKHKTKAAVTRDDVYTFAWGAVDAGYAELGAAAVICFEWLQRPENVLAGYIGWNNYRPPASPATITIEHHKTGASVPHPLEERTSTGLVKFYAEAEDILAKVPQRGVPIVLRQMTDGTTKPWDNMQAARVIRALREALELPPTFTLDACRHGGMTELEEAELTEGQGRALSAHKSKAYERYAKRTEKRALAATRKRHAHRVALLGNDAAGSSETAEFASNISGAKST